MKLLRVAPSFQATSILGGLEPNIYYLSLHQARQGHEIVIAAPKTAGADGDRLPDAVELSIIRARRPPAARATWGLAAVRAGLRAGFSPDIVHGINPACLGWLCPLARRTLGRKCRLVLSLHCSHLHGGRQFRALALWVARHVSGVVAVSPQVRRELVSDGIESDKIRVIPSGVDVELFGASPLETYDLAAFIGGFRPVKRIPLLVSAFSRLTGSSPHVRLLLVGADAGPESERVIECVRTLGLEDWCKVVGIAPHRELPIWYRKASFTVLCSETEGLGKTLLESNSVGRATIGPDTGGVPYVIQDGHTGLLFQTGDCDDLAEKMSSLFGDTKKLEKMGRKGCRMVRHRAFDWRSVAARHTAFFEELLPR